MGAVTSPAPAERDVGFPDYTEICVLSVVGSAWRPESPMDH